MQNFRALGAPPTDPHASGGWGFAPTANFFLHVWITKYPYLSVVLPCRHASVYCPHCILSFDLCLGPHFIISCYALAIKQPTKNDFQKRTSYTKVNLNDQAIFRKFLQIAFAADTKLKMIGTITAHCKQTFNYNQTKNT